MGGHKGHATVGEECVDGVATRVGESVAALPQWSECVRECMWVLWVWVLGLGGYICVELHLACDALSMLQRQSGMVHVHVYVIGLWY